MGKIAKTFAVLSFTGLVGLGADFGRFTALHEQELAKIDETRMAVQQPRMTLLYDYMARPNRVANEKGQKFMETRFAEIDFLIRLKGHKPTNADVNDLYETVLNHPTNSYVVKASIDALGKVNSKDSSDALSSLFLDGPNLDTNVFVPGYSANSSLNFYLARLVYEKNKKMINKIKVGKNLYYSDIISGDKSETALKKLLDADDIEGVSIFLARNTNRKVLEMHLEDLYKMADRRLLCGNASNSYLEDYLSQLTKISPGFFREELRNAYMDKCDNTYNRGFMDAITGEKDFSSRVFRGYQERSKIRDGNYEELDHGIKIFTMETQH